MRSRSEIGRIVLVAVMVGVATAPGLARAGTSSSIVIESYEGERPADAAAVLAPVYAELAKRGFIAQDKLVSVVEQSISRGAGQLSASQSADAQKAVAQGYAHFIDGDYQKAVESERVALALYGQATGTLAKEPALRDLEYKALMVTARSQEVLGANEDAFSSMAEAIRLLPDRPFNPSEFDPEVRALYKRVKDELVRRGTGTLEVKVDEPTAVIFLDERFVGTGSVKLDGLLPGRYRVYIAKGDQPGRVHDVEVSAGGNASIDVSWAIDGVLRTRTGYVGFEAPRGAGTDEEIGSAVRVARAVGVRSVVVLGIRDVEGRRSIVAYSIGAESQTKVFGAVQIEPIAPPTAILAKLAALMAGDKVADASIITKEPAPIHKRRVIGTRPSAFHKLKWGFGGAAVLGLSAGGALILIDNKPAPGGTRVESYHDTKNLGLGVLAGGAALAAVAIYMFTADHDVEIEAEESPHAVTIAPVIAPDSVGLAVGGQFW
jgi:hypothetical protein